MLLKRSERVFCNSKPVRNSISISYIRPFVIGSLIIKVNFSFVYNRMGVLRLVLVPISFLPKRKNHFTRMSPRTLRRISISHRYRAPVTFQTTRFVKCLKIQIILAFPNQNVGSRHRSPTQIGFRGARHSYSLFFPFKTISACSIPYITKVPIGRRYFICSFISASSSDRKMFGISFGIPHIIFAAYKNRS